MTEVIELPKLSQEQVTIGLGLPSPSSLNRRRVAITELDDIRIPQGSAFIEDAIYDRLTYHKCDRQFLKLYKIHGSWPCQMVIGVTIFILHMLIFFEHPSSLTLASDIRSPDHFPLTVPFPTTLICEGFCLVCLAFDCSVKVYGFGVKHIRSYPWHILYILSLIVGFAGWVLAICFGNMPCGVYCKIRCFVRPAILLQHSALMKKAFLCLTKAIPSIFSVFLLFFIHVVLFTLVGLVIMPYDLGPAQGGPPGKYNIHFGEGASTALMNMFVLLTTSNNPDIMTKAYNANRLYAIFFIVYVAIGVHFLLHILFAVIFQKFREHFRESMRHTVLRRKAALVAAFEVLSDVDDCTLKRFVPIDRLRKVIHSLSLRTDLMNELLSRFENVSQSSIKIDWRVFFRDIFNHVVFLTKFKRNKLQEDKLQNFDPLRDHNRTYAQAKTDFRSSTTDSQPFFSCMRLIFAHPLFVHVGSALNLINVLVILLQQQPGEGTAFIEKETFIFIIWCLIEQSALCWALRPEVYFSHPVHRLDLMTLVPSLLCTVFFIVVHHGLQDLPGNDGTIAEKVLAGLTHIFIGLRLLRVILSMKLPNLIFKTTADLLINLAPFAGLLACFYYIFALLGMILFAKKITYQPEFEGCWRFEGNDSSIANLSEVGSQCPYGGPYHQRDYWSENFDDFASSLVILWNLMLVNNWDVIVNAFAKATNAWSQLYFIAWYISSVGMTLSLLTAVTVENFLRRWSVFEKHEKLRKHALRVEKVTTEREVAELLTRRVSQGATTVKAAMTYWRNAKLLRKKRAYVDIPNGDIVAGHESQSHSVEGSADRPSQSQPLSLIQVLDVKMPSMEEIRQHLALSPYSPTNFVINVNAFNSTYSLLPQN